MGLLLVQSAWILAVPPYRAIDEFDHVYRANSVVEGYVRTWGGPVDGRGDLIPVRRSLILDGREICRSYRYTGPDNCRPVEDLGGGLSSVASAASRYNPVTYWLHGVPTLLLDGAAAVYAMRWTAALACAALIAVAGFVVAGYARTPFPLAGMMLALTPVLVYSTAIPAPNGLEMAAGVGLWAGLLALPRSPHQRLSLALIGTSAILVAGLRPLGFIWISLALGLALSAMSGPELLMTFRRHRRPLVAMLAATAVAAASSIVWTASSKTYAIDIVDPGDISRWLVGFREMPVWTLQAIAAFPNRNDAAPIIVYPLVLLPFLFLVVLGAKHANRRMRGAIAATAVLTLAVPYAFTVATVMKHGTVWQGRYALPLSIGLVLLAGHALERAGQTTALRPRASVPLAIAFIAAHTISVVAVQLREQANSPLSGDERWWMAPAYVPGFMAALGITLVCAAVIRHGRGTDLRSSAAELTVGRKA